MYVHSFSYLVNKLELGGYTYLQLKKYIVTISPMTNYVSINNTILRDIVRCFNSQYWSRFVHKKVGLVFDEKTHCFQRYNQSYRKTGNN